MIGTSCAGKSILVKNLAKKHQGTALEENDHDAKLPELDSREFPGLTYTRDLKDWHEFIRRTPDEYAAWLESTKKECEIVELRMIEELFDCGLLIPEGPGGYDLGDFCPAPPKAPRHIPNAINTSRE